MRSVCTSATRGPERTGPFIILAIKIMKLVIYLFLEFDSKFGFNSIILVLSHSNSN
jgi:hypothetical protein